MFSASPMILSNGLMAMPTASQGVVYNQLPDGTLIPMHSGGQNLVQTIMTSQMPIIVNQQPGNTGQLIQTANGGTLLMSPGQPGLLQMSTLQQPQQAGQLSPYQQGQTNYVTMGQVQMMPGGLQQVSPNTLMTYNVSQTRSTILPAAKISPNQKSKDKVAQAKTSPKPVKPVSPVESEDSDDEDEPLYATNDEESDEEEDEDEDVVVGAKAVDAKKTPATKKTIIQSNKVDSSGLKATPPHHLDETDQKLASPGKKYC